jgi:serine/threonine protein kinase
MTGSIDTSSRLAVPLGRLGDYHLIRRLAQGGMGEVFLAKRVGVGGFEKTFAIKRMLDSLSGSEEFVAMFFDEARLAARLSHPNIAQIYDFGQVDGHYYLAMEHIPGEDLNAIIKLLFERGLDAPLPIALRIVTEICNGLEYAHTLSEDGQPLGIIHRDVSPSNVMVSYQGAVKLLDFGIAKATSRLAQTRTNSMKGKVSFVAPEQIRGLPLDGRADLFSLGICFYALLTRRHPFRRDSEVATMHAINQGATPDPRQLRPDLPPAIAAIVTRALARERDDRFASAADMRAALQEALATLNVGRSGPDIGPWLAELFGIHRMHTQSAVPILSTVDLAAVVTPTPHPVAWYAGTATSVATPPRPSAPARSRWGGPARLAAAALVGSGLVILAGQAREALVNSPSSSPALSSARPAPPPPLVSPSPLPSALPLPSVSASASRSPSPPSPSVSAPTPRARPRLDPLDLPTLHSVVRRSQARFTACFRRHADAVPTGNGEVRIELAVTGNGKVSEARVIQSAVAASALATCLETEARRLRFPRHPEAEVRFALPLAYRRGD